MYGIEATTELIRELRAAQPTGIHLQRRNIETPDQVRDLIASLRREVGPLEFAVRHEGGAETPNAVNDQMAKLNQAFAR